MTKPAPRFAPLRRTCAAAALAAACFLPSSLQAHAAAPEGPPALSSLQSDLLRPDNAELRRFYYYRGNRPLWIANGQLTPAALQVKQLVDTADLDGIAPDKVFARDLDAAVTRAQAEGTSHALGLAELALSRSFAAYVRQTLQTPDASMMYEHVSLEPQLLDVAAVLQAAAKAPSLETYVETMAWLHPLYAPLRRAFVAAGGEDSGLRNAYLSNLARVRGLPAVPPGTRYVLVNAAAARLWMYDGSRPVDSMKVVVGKTDHQTPVMAGYIRYAILNPYWNVPADFTRDRIAPKVLKFGTAYLRQRGFEVMSDWTADAKVVDPQSIDWRAAAAGTTDVRVRQLPGAANSMGKVKFEFPNKLGIYLHDTPEQELMTKDTRLYSSGCVRLEDAQRLGRWLFDSPLPAAQQVEQRVDLPKLVPVYVTYLTLQPTEDGGVLALGDPYGRDGNETRTFAAEVGRSNALHR